MQLSGCWGAHMVSDGCARAEMSPKFISAGNDVSQGSLCEVSSCPCGGQGLHRAEEGAMATGIHGIINVGCKEERGEGWMGGLCSQVKLLLGVACTDSTVTRWEVKH